MMEQEKGPACLRVTSVYPQVMTLWQNRAAARPGGPGLPKRRRTRSPDHGPQASFKTRVWGLGVWLAVHVSTAVANGFSFTGPELFPIEDGISNLRVADLDGDGLQDLVVVNNRRARITLLYNRTGKEPEALPDNLTRPREPNELPPDARFEIRSVASEKRVLALEVADVNGDGRPDLVYYGEPRELVVQLNEGQRRWGTPRRWAVPDVPFSPHVLAVGDLDGDGTVEVFLLGEAQIHRFQQGAEGRLERLEPLPLGQSAYSLQLLDVNGDGRLDLVLVNWESPDPIRVRFQRPAGAFGPEILFRLPAIRAYWADREGPTGPAHLVAVGQASGRALLARFAREAGEPLGPFTAGQFEVFPVPRTERVRRGMVWADANGDGIVDLLAADPDTGHLLVQWGEADGDLRPPAQFPTLMGVTEIIVEDWDGDGHPEIFLLSPEEKVIGVSRVTEAEIVPFPRLLPMVGRPMTMTSGKRTPAEPVTLAVVLDQEGSRSLVLWQAQGQLRRLDLNPAFKGPVSHLAWHDVDRDGRTDLVLLASYERIKVLRQLEDGEFEELDVPPPGGVLENPWLTWADLDADGQPEMLLGQRNLLRAVRLRSVPGPTGPAAWSFEVLEQINADDRDARLTAAGSLFGPDGRPVLCTLDAQHRSLRLFQRGVDGLWQQRGRLALSRSDFSGLRFVPGDSQRAPALLFTGPQAAARLRLGGHTWTLLELDQYETPVRDGYLRDVVSGDLDGDGRKEWVFLETARHYVDIVRWNGDRFEPGDRWPVFEQRSFQAMRTPRFEPREAAVADVTGDGRNDLILIVHDRVLVYPQD